MFPKFLRLATFEGYKIPVWINETHTIEKIVLNNRDQNVLDIYSRALGFSYEIVFPPLEFRMRLPNGSWAGALGMLERGEVDMVVGDLTIYDELQEEFHVSYPNLIAEITFTTKNHEYVPNPAVFLHPFSTPVWLSIIACIFLMSFVFYKLLRKKHSAVSLFTSTLGSLVGQGMSIPPHRPRDYIVLASWIISSALLYYFYAAVLLSFLTFPSNHGIRTIMDLAHGIQEGKYECSTYPNVAFPNFFRNSSNLAERVIGNQMLTQYPYINSFDYLEVTSGKKKRAFVGNRLNLMSYEEFYFISEENFFFVLCGYAMSKKFCCGEELDQVAQRIWASGIMERILSYNRNYFFSQFLKTEYWKIPPTEGKLTMAMLKGPFLFLIASHSLAFLVFLIEVCIGRFKN